MSDILGGIVLGIELAVAIGMTLCIYYLLRPKPAIRRIWPLGFNIKKIQPNWGNQCILCGSPIVSNQCPKCQITRPVALDQIVYKYLTANDGVLARSEITSSVHVSNHELDESIERLTKAGRISPIREVKDVRGIIS
jgi:hypothetical protein